MRKLFYAAIVITLAIGLVITACGGKGAIDNNKTYADVGEMRTTLATKGIVGTDWWEGYILYAETAGRLQLGSDHRLELTTFANEQAQSNYISVVESVGGVIVEGNLWVVVADTMSDAQAVQAALGGNI